MKTLTTTFQGDHVITETARKITPLGGHVSPETAYVVDDYPYGFTLRCKIRYWIETAKKGQRFCSQTTNPRRSANGDVWNAPKKSVYTDLRTMYIDNETGHVEADGLSTAYDSEAKIRQYIETYGAVLTSDYEKATSRFALLMAVTRRHMETLTEGKNIFEYPVYERLSIMAKAKELAKAELNINNNKGDQDND